MLIGLRAICARRAHTIVIMTDPPLLVLWAPLLWLRHRARIIYWCHDVYPDLLPYVAFPIMPLLMAWLRSAKRLALKNCAQIVALGPCMSDYLLQHYELPTTKLKIITNWHNCQLAAKTSELNSIKNILNNKFVVLYAGNLGKLHPYDHFLATAQALQNNPQFHFIVAGYGQGRIACETAAANLPNVTFMPFLSDAAVQQLQQLVHIHWASLSAAATQLAVPVKAMAAFAAQRPLIWDGAAHATTAQMVAEYQAGVCISGAADAVEKLQFWYHNPVSYALACQGARQAHERHHPQQQWYQWQVLLNTPHPVAKAA